MSSNAAIRRVERIVEALFSKIEKQIFVLKTLLWMRSCFSLTEAQNVLHFTYRFKPI